MASGTNPPHTGEEGRNHDPLCDECGWEESHVRHHSPVLYNFHAFMAAAPKEGSKVMERTYIYIIEGEPYVGTLRDFANALKHAAYSDVDVSRVLWEYDADRGAFFPVDYEHHSTGFNEDDWATVTISANGEEASYSVDGRA